MGSRQSPNELIDEHPTESKSQVEIKAAGLAGVIADSERIGRSPPSAAS